MLVEVASLPVVSSPKNNKSLLGVRWSTGARWLVDRSEVVWKGDSELLLIYSHREYFPNGFGKLMNMIKWFIRRAGSVSIPTFEFPYLIFEEVVVIRVVTSDWGRARGVARGGARVHVEVVIRLVLEDIRLGVGLGCG